MSSAPGSKQQPKQLLVKPKPIDIEAEVNALVTSADSMPMVNASIAVQTECIEPENRDRIVGNPDALLSHARKRTPKKVKPKDQQLFIHIYGSHYKVLTTITTPSDNEFHLEHFNSLEGSDLVQVVTSTLSPLPPPSRGTQTEMAAANTAIAAIQTAAMQTATIAAQCNDDIFNVALPLPTIAEQPMSLQQQLLQADSNDGERKSTATVATSTSDLLWSTTPLSHTVETSTTENVATETEAWASMAVATQTEVTAVQQSLDPVLMPNQLKCVLQETPELMVASLPFTWTMPLELVPCLDIVYRNEIIHCYMKVEHVLFQQRGRSVIKAMDFGLACYEYQRARTYIQSFFNRAPETLLSLKCDRTIDMWSLGCIIVNLLCSYALFPSKVRDEQLVCIIEMLGMPSKPLMVHANHAQAEDCVLRPNRDDAGALTGGQPPYDKSHGSQSLKSLSRTLGDYEELLLLNFIRCCLDWDPENPLPPDEALKSSWWIQSHQHTSAEAVDGATATTPPMDCSSASEALLTQHPIATSSRLEAIMAFIQENFRCHKNINNRWNKLISKYLSNRSSGGDGDGDGINRHGGIRSLANKMDGTTAGTLLMAFFCVATTVRQLAQ